MLLDSFAVTHIGRRTNNEDNACNQADLGLFAVADGMGGYEGGELASALAIEQVRDFVARHHRDPDGTWPGKGDKARTELENVAAAATELAHRAIVEHRVGVHQQMGSTVALMYVVGAKAVLAHVGDSRVYRLREGVLHALTRDHSLWAELDASGEAPARENFGHRNLITRALGIPEAHRADTSVIDLLPGDLYLLCSDGLYDPLPAQTLRSWLSHASLPDIGNGLVQAALDAGGSDNITAVIVRVR